MDSDLRHDASLQAALSSMSFDEPIRTVPKLSLGLDEEDDFFGGAASDDEERQEVRKEELATFSAVPSIPQPIARPQHSASPVINAPVPEEADMISPERPPRSPRPNFLAELAPAASSATSTPTKDATAMPLLTSPDHLGPSPQRSELTTSNRSSFNESLQGSEVASPSRSPQPTPVPIPAHVRSASSMAPSIRSQAASVSGDGSPSLARNSSSSEVLVTDDLAAALEQEDRPRRSSFFGLEQPMSDSPASQSYSSPALSGQVDAGPSYESPASSANRSAVPSTSSSMANFPGASEAMGRRSSFFGMEGAPIAETSSAQGSGGSDAASTNSGQRNSYTTGQLQAPRQPAVRASRTMSTMYGDLPAGDRSSISPIALLNQSHLKVGAGTSLLSHDRTLELYRMNAKKTNDPDVSYELALLMMDVAKDANQRALESKTNGAEASPISATSPIATPQRRAELVNESISILKKLADRGHVGSQTYLGNCYAQGIGTAKGKPDYDKAFPLFILSGKHGDAEGCYRSGQCCENGWGCRKDNTKAFTWYKKAAAAQHPWAMYRLGLAEINNELGLQKRQKEGFKWMKRAAELAEIQPEAPTIQALHELALLHEKGIEHVVFVDYEYAAECLAKAAELGYAPSAYKLGECYEYGRMGCPMDSALSIHYYTQQNHREACFALTAWYLVGSPGVLPQSDTEAYLWAKKAAELGLAKAEYAVGYFTEVGIGTNKDLHEALSWFRKAAEHDDKRAIARLKANAQQQAEIARENAAKQAAHKREMEMREQQRRHEAERRKREEEERLLAQAREKQERDSERHREEAARRERAEQARQRRIAEEANRIRGTPGALTAAYFSNPENILRKKASANNIPLESRGLQVKTSSSALGPISPGQRSASPRSASATPTSRALPSLPPGAGSSPRSMSMPPGAAGRSSALPNSNQIPIYAGRPPPVHGIARSTSPSGRDKDDCTLM